MVIVKATEFTLKKGEFVWLVNYVSRKLLPKSQVTMDPSFDQHQKSHVIQKDLGFYQKSMSPMSCTESDLSEKSSHAEEKKNCFRLFILNY